MTATTTQRCDTEQFPRAPSAPPLLAPWPLGVLGDSIAAHVPDCPRTSPNGSVCPSPTRKEKSNPPPATCNVVSIGEQSSPAPQRATARHKTPQNARECPVSPGHSSLGKNRTQTLNFVLRNRRGRACQDISEEGNRGRRKERKGDVPAARVKLRLGNQT